MINIELIKNGSMNGKIIYVCDYRYTDISKKCARNVKPTKVIITSNSETSKTIYYSNSHLVVLDKNDKPTNKIIQVFDNTGYRSYPGIPLNCFETEQECIEYFKSQVNIIITNLEEYKNNTIKYTSDKIDELKLLI